ncbi:hypothetical protein, partial [Sutterella wadsworthensis]|uniref:hypothetical protein n=1 Tax=Sutterella wadsworthensis TaxID=40545 RepID=UPI003967A97B
MISASRRNRKEKIWKLNYAPQSTIKPDRLASSAWVSTLIPFGITQKKVGRIPIAECAQPAQKKVYGIKTLLRSFSCRDRKST